MNKTNIRLARHFFEKFYKAAPRLAYNLILEFESRLNEYLEVEDLLNCIEDEDWELGDILAANLEKKVPNHPAITVYEYEKTYKANSA